jgi:hypothetical protein
MFFTFRHVEFCEISSRRVGERHFHPDSRIAVIGSLASGASSCLAKSSPCVRCTQIYLTRVAFNIDASRSCSTCLGRMNPRFVQGGEDMSRRPRKAPSPHRKRILIGSGRICASSCYESRSLRSFELVTYIYPARVTVIQCSSAKFDWLGRLRSQLMSERILK